jgi:hypothetical protein
MVGGVNRNDEMRATSCLFVPDMVTIFRRSTLACLLVPGLAGGQTYDWSGVANLYGNPGVKQVSTTWGGKTVSCVQIDTRQGNLRFYTTERCSPYVEDSQETQTRKTTEFVSDSQSTSHKVVVAINATEFNPVIVGKVDLLGYAAWEGLFVSRNAGPALVVGKDGVAVLANLAAGAEAAAVQAAVSGQQWVLTEGTPYPASGGNANRTAVGISQDGRYVYFLTMGSAQTGQNGEALKYFGAYNAVQLDGGGSTGMAAWNGSSVVSLFSSTRSVGNNIGVYFNNAAVVLARSPAALAPGCLRGQNAAPQNIEVWNGGGSNLVYAVTDDAAWMSVSPTNGASLEERDALQVTYATAGLAAGIYYGAITISASSATNSPQTVAVTLTINPVIPSAPTNLHAVAVSDTRIDLHWTDCADDEDGFRIERSIDGTHFIQAGVVSTNATGCSDTGLAHCTKYWYRICAYNGAGTSAYSLVDSATTAAPAVDLAVTCSNIALSFLSFSNYGYRLQGCSDLSSWTNVTDVITASQGLVTLKDSATRTNPMFYYRLVITPP